MKTPLRLAFRLMLTMLALCLSSSALAQYVWIDANNVRHYSDMPPPSSVPNSRIMKTPKGAFSAAPVFETATSDSNPAKKTESSAITQQKAPLTLAEKNADFQKRKMEQAEKDKKAAEQEKRDAAKAKYCEDLQSNKRTLESGIRIAEIDKKGERAYMTDEQRARELEQVRQKLEQCK